jgi:hypothetical protein
MEVEAESNAKRTELGCSLASSQLVAEVGIQRLEEGTSFLKLLW